MYDYLLSQERDLLNEKILKLDGNYFINNRTLPLKNIAIYLISESR